MKSILFTYITPFHPERGGIGRVTHSLTIELQKRGYRVFYLIFDSAITIKHPFTYPAPIEYFPSKELLSTENRTFYHHFLKEQAIDVVINQSGNFDDSMLYIDKGCRNKSVKIISVLHSTPWVSYMHLWNTIYPLRNNTSIEKLKRMMRIFLYPKIKKEFKKNRIEQFQRLLPQTDLVCLLSKSYYKELSDICPGYENKYIAIPNPNTFSPEELCQYKTKKKKQLLFVGLLHIDKGADRIINVWNQIYTRYPEWELIIIGDGATQYLKRLKKIAANTERIYFKGFQSPLPYYQSSSILCMASNYEGWGMVLTEAMQCGTVPIAFNSFASVYDIIHNNSNGILVTPFDLKEYEIKLCKLMDDTVWRERLSKEAERDVKKYDIEKVVDLWEQVF